MAEENEKPYKRRGDFVSRFEIISQLGSGGMGVVYKAHDPHLDKVVGLKVVKSTNLSDQLQLRFQKEAKALKELTHGSIPEIYNFAISRDNEPYLVLEYVEGETLADLLEQKGKLDLEEAIDIFIPICEALAYAHSNGVVHRDIKPENIILSRDNEDELQVKLIDFGLAKLESELIDSQDLTVTGRVIGTPAYMSPEQIRSEKIGAASDIYSFGCVFYEILTGRPPFLGASALETASMHLTAPVEDAIANLPDGTHTDTVYNIAFLCLQKEVPDRFENASEIIKLLRDVKAELNEDSVEESAPEEELSAKPTNGAPKKQYIFIGLLALSMLFIIYAYKTKIETEIKEVAPPQVAKEKDDKPFHALDPFGENTWHKFAFAGPGGWAAGQGITDEDFRILTGKPKVYYITSVFSDSVTGKGLKYLRNSDLVAMHLSSENLTDNAISETTYLPKLEKLSLKGSDKFSEKGMRKLQQLRHLNILSLTSSKLPPNTINVISKIKSLKAVTLDGCYPVKVKELEKLKKLPGLEVLLLDNTKFDKKDLRFLTHLNSLKILSVARLGLNDNDIYPLTKLPLEYIDLSKNSITNKSVIALSKIKSLRMIRISKCKNIDLPKLKKFADENHIYLKMVPKYEQSIKLSKDNINDNNRLEITIFSKPYDAFSAPSDYLKLKY